MKIKILDSLVANQIAAGEVIERPASIVKECLENSLDAGATQLSIDIMQGGIQSIHIVDNGHGIAKEDLPNAMQRHGTSKIFETKDLEAIASLGFRGEALASIAAVARVTLASAIVDAEYGWQLIAAGTDAKILEQPIAHPIGTSITIRDLFFNTPARRRFLRTEKTEFSHIEEVVRRIALSRFNLSLKLTHNQRQIFQLPVATTALLQDKRLSQLCGKEFIEAALKLDMQATGLRLWGWLAEPKFSRSQIDLQYLYINGRMVRDKLLNHAIRLAYQDQLHRDHYPAYVLFLECDPSSVDVNVHPTKHEVRFHESRLIHDFVVVSLRKVLHGESYVIANEVKQSSLELDSITSARNDGNKTYQHSSVSPLAIAEQTAIYSNLVAIANEVKQSSAELDCIATLAMTNLGEPLTIIANNFLITKNIDSIGIINLQKVNTLLFEKALSKKNISSKPLLFPLTINLSEKLLKNLSLQFQLLQDVGFILELLGERQLVLRQTPIVMEKVDFTLLINQLAEQLIKSENFIKEISKIAAASIRHFETKAQQEKLLQTMQSQLTEAEFKICYQTINADQLERMFKRV